MGKDLRGLRERDKEPSALREGPGMTFNNANNKIRGICIQIYVYDHYVKLCFADI